MDDDLLLPALIDDAITMLPFLQQRFAPKATLSLRVGIFFHLGNWYNASGAMKF